ncbi:MULTISPECIES: nitroreductase family deazaflavin-dependent oxidoreductase [unclassified Actinomadura]|uniref:nitroreductase family deazaflavin-dependent oxidoreductase n=1 Tax=unclassified Actinomadura TaxID=2626254 RepID=UPI0011EF12AE|nr:nitroreductase family deazaflavin-dependent oxidoreductase [Actinomadura sp. K4S16]
MEIVDRPAPPTGLRRLLWRLPIRLYRIGLGPLLGRRVMLLTHTGRVSGLPRQVVIEVVQKDEHGCVAASGFGPRADWYRNVMANPDVTLQIGGKRIQATAASIPAGEGGEIMARYAPRHPTAARQLCKLMGFAVDGSVEDYREVGRHIPFVRFTYRPVARRRSTA